MTEKDVLREILEGSEFTQYAKEEPEQGQNVLELLLERLFDWLGRMFPDIEMAEGSQDVLTYGIIGAGLVVLVVLAVFLSRLIWIERRAGRRMAAAHAEELEQAPVDLVSRALAAASGGDYREATRLMFLALLLGFQRQELLRVEAWKTNWEYAEELERQGSRWVPMFRESALRFDTVWYGGRDIAPEEFDAWRRQVESAIAEARQGTGGAA